MTLLRPQSSRRAFTLVECMAYIALFLLVLGVTLSAYYRMDEHARGLDRNSTDIIRAVQAGEQWREDLRQATAAPRFENEGAIRIPHTNGEVRYSFNETAIFRQGAMEKQPQKLLANVKVSDMKPDVRQRVTAWRWEIELQTQRNNATLRPLFTFIGVVGGKEAP
jgi:hypothetical protein